MTFKALVISAIIGLSSTGGAARAVQVSPWTDCAFARSEQTIRTMPCRVSMPNPRSLSVHWADNVNDTFRYQSENRAVDSRGGLWKVEKQLYEGTEYIFFESFSSGTVFAIREF